MEFLHEIQLTRWALTCSYSAVLLWLLGLTRCIVAPHPMSIIPVLLLFLQLIFFGLFTFQIRSRSARFLKFKFQIPFLHNWAIPTFVVLISVACICLFTYLLRSDYRLHRTDKEKEQNEESVHKIPYSVFDVQLETLDATQIALHGLHLINLLWGFNHFMRCPWVIHYDPIVGKAHTSPSQSLHPRQARGTSSHLALAYRLEHDRLSARLPRKPVPARADPSLGRQQSDPEFNGLYITSGQKKCTTTAMIVRFAKKTRPWHVWHFWFLQSWTVLNGLIILMTCIFIGVKVHQIQAKWYDGVFPKAYLSLYFNPLGGILVLIATWWLLTRGGHSLDVKRQQPPGWRSESKFLGLHTYYISTETGSRSRRDPRKVRLAKLGQENTSQILTGIPLSNIITGCGENCRGQWFKQGTRVSRRKAWICAVTTMAVGTFMSCAGLAIIIVTSTKTVPFDRGEGVARMTSHTGTLVSGIWSFIAVVFTSIAIRLFR